MADIIHRVGIRASAQQVDEALSTIAGIAGWWTEQTSGSSEIGVVFSYGFFHWMERNWEYAHGSKSPGTGKKNSLDLPGRTRGVD